MKHIRYRPAANRKMQEAARLFDTACNSPGEYGIIKKSHAETTARREDGRKNRKGTD
jgi:hypothetical protein